MPSDKINQYVQQYVQKTAADLMAAINAPLPCGHHRGCIWTGEDGTWYCVACKAVAVERVTCAKIARNECRAAGVSAIGRDVAAAILACGEEGSDAE